MVEVCVLPRGHGPGVAAAHRKPSWPGRPRRRRIKADEVDSARVVEILEVPEGRTTTARGAVQGVQVGAPPLVQSVELRDAGEAEARGKTTNTKKTICEEEEEGSDADVESYSSTLSIVKNFTKLACSAKEVHTAGQQRSQFERENMDVAQMEFCGNMVRLKALKERWEGALKAAEQAEKAPCFTGLSFKQRDKLHLGDPVQVHRPQLKDHGTYGVLIKFENSWFADVKFPSGSVKGFNTSHLKEPNYVVQPLAVGTQVSVIRSLGVFDVAEVVELEEGSVQTMVKVRYANGEEQSVPEDYVQRMEDPLKVGDVVCVCQARSGSAASSGHIGRVSAVDRSSPYPITVDFFEPLAGVVERFWEHDLRKMVPKVSQCQRAPILEGGFRPGQRVRRSDTPVVVLPELPKFVDVSTPDFVNVMTAVRPQLQCVVLGEAVVPGFLNVALDNKEQVLTDQVIAGLPKARMLPEELITEATYQRRLAQVAEATLRQLEKSQEDKRFARESSAQVVRSAEERLASVAKKRYQLEYELSQAKSRAKTCKLKKLVRFSGCSRPAVWRDLPRYVSCQWCMEVAGASDGRRAFLSIADILPICQDIRDEAERENLLAVRGKPLCGMHGKQSRTVTISITKSDVTEIVNMAGNREEKPVGLHSVALLKAALGVMDSVALDDEVQSFFNNPHTGIIRMKDIQIPPSLAGVLRPYQVTGFQWLVSNALNGLGCMLADDMGLGKTLQVVAFLQYLKDNDPLIAPALVVVPVSLIQTWVREVKKWAPKFSVYVYHGKDRRLPRIFCHDEATAASGVVAVDGPDAEAARADLSSSSSSSAAAARKPVTMGLARPQPRAAPAGAVGVRWRSGVLQPDAEALWTLPGGTEERRAGVRRPRSKLSSGVNPDIMLTSYQTLARDANRFLKPGRFSSMILDEAQHIKNYNTLVTRSVKAVAQGVGSIRISLSGTPVENRLSDLHSQFEFILPGFLADSAQHFDREFSRPITSSGDIAKSRLLKQMTKPFVLRRLKTDPDVATDLPDKVEQSYDCELSPMQTTLYMAVQETFKRTMKTSLQQHSGRRKHMVLSLIHSLREVCNHPANLSMKRWPASVPVESCPPRTKADASGKCMVLLEILSTILANGEKTLIFCQYIETIEILAEQIECIFGIHVLKFVGSMNKHEREDTVDKFQSHEEYPIMLLSLQVGGLGLTLTAATHVIHFDRCYNPARENQATDRAHRIGQNRTVFVHTLISQSTFEHRLSAVMEKKQQLSDLTIQPGVGWLADLNDKELLDFLCLCPADAGDSLQDANDDIPDAKRPRHTITVD